MSSSSQASKQASNYDDDDDDDGDIQRENEMRTGKLEINFVLGGMK